MTKKRLNLTIVSVLLFFLVGVQGVDANQDFEFFINGGYTGAMKVLDTDYGWYWGTDYVDIEESGYIFQDVSPKFSVAAGFNYFFNNSFGLSVAAHYLKQNVYTGDGYEFSWAWVNDAWYSDERNWGHTGEISIIPITIDLVYRTSVNRRLVFQLYGGLALYMTDIKLYSNIGYGVTLETEDSYYVDWFKLAVGIEQQESLVGVHGGMDVEHRISRNLGICLGVQYFYAPTKTYRWEVIEQAQYDGELGSLYSTETPDIHVDGDITAKFDFSFYRAFAGIKIHF